MAILNRNVRHNKQVFDKGMKFAKNHAYYKVFEDKGFFKKEDEMKVSEAPAAINAAANEDKKSKEEKKADAKAAKEAKEKADKAGNDAPPAAKEKIVG